MPLPAPAAPIRSCNKYNQPVVRPGKISRKGERGRCLSVANRARAFQPRSAGVVTPCMLLTSQVFIGVAMCEGSIPFPRTGDSLEVEQ